MGRILPGTHGVEVWEMRQESVVRRLTQVGCPSCGTGCIRSLNGTGLLGYPSVFDSPVVDSSEKCFFAISLAAVHGM